MDTDVPSRKKKQFPVQDFLLAYLMKYGRSTHLPVTYRDLLAFNNSIPLIDDNGNDTLWESVVYPPDMAHELYVGLTVTYAMLKTGGDLSVTEHLYVDRVDYCSFGNSYPFRIRIVNHYNDNYDYFYVKRADASRIYGLELEELLSPNQAGYLFHRGSLIEEHVAGIPGDDFIRRAFGRRYLNRVRLAKEFVKFNERCFVRLLGDMRSYNYVVITTPDFDGEQYRVRAFDFDQQSYEGRKNVYLPQFFKDNLPVVKLCTDHLNLETSRQYQNEERTLIWRRMQAAGDRFDDLRRCMVRDTLSEPEKVVRLREELGEFHRASQFLECQTMGEVLFMHIEHMLAEARRHSSKTAGAAAAG